METKDWICDTCGQKIQDPEHGWVEWLAKSDDSGKRSLRGVRLVHHCTHSPLGGENKCQYDGNYEYKKDGHLISDMELKYFLGPNGLMELLSMLSDENVPKEEIIEMIKRLHIPGYERARRHFDEAISEGVFDPNSKPSFYMQSDIKATLTWMDANGIP